MLDLVSRLPATFASIDFSIAGGVLLLLDMIFFAILAANWEQAGRMRLRSEKGDAPRKR